MYWTRDWFTGRQVLQGHEGGEAMNGTNVTDMIFGNDGNDLIAGHGGDDFVYGGDGRDIIKGGGGADYLNGGMHDDILAGGTGRDILTGGHGQDSFQFSLGDSWANSASADHITDYRSGDTIDVSDYVMSHRTFGSNSANLTMNSMESAQYSANALASTYGYGSALYQSSNGRDVYVLLDLNGDRYMETGIVLENLPHFDEQWIAANHNWIFS
jgi:Ca2+-binding RTX toxin-like protein